MKKSLQILDQVEEERRRQDKKWGGPDHDDQHTFDEMMKFLGDKVDFAVAEFDNGSYSQSRKRMIQVSALAVAMVEYIDRKHK